MRVDTRCRGCGWTGNVAISLRNWPGKRPAVTGVPCPKCGKYRLQRVSTIIHQQRIRGWPVTEKVDGIILPRFNADGVKT